MSRVMKFASVPVAVAVLLGACASGPRETNAQLQADKVTAEQVEIALNGDTALYAKHISAHANNGIVYLTGYVWEAGDFELASAIAENVPGVTKVVNDLELNRNGNDNGAVSR